MTVEITVTLTLTSEDQSAWRLVTSTRRDGDAGDPIQVDDFRVERKVLPTGSSTLAPGMYAPVAS